METDKGTLYLIPSLLGDNEPHEVLPMSVKKVLDKSLHFIVENEKSARAFIKKVLPSKNQSEMHIEVLNKYTELEDLMHFLKPCEMGHDVGVISEAGAPGIADPGSEVVKIAHHKGIRVVPLSGPSSILMAMMASGMNGQNFAFNGYLPIDKSERKRALKNLESIAKKTGQSQIFMETPYRNMKLYKDIIDFCSPESQLCLASDISLSTETIKTQNISAWSRTHIDLDKRPTIFILSNTEF